MKTLLCWKKEKNKDERTYFLFNNLGDEKEKKMMYRFTMYA